MAPEALTNICILCRSVSEAEHQLSSAAPAGGGNPPTSDLCGRGLGLRAEDWIRGEAAAAAGWSCLDAARCLHVVSLRVTSSSNPGLLHNTNKYD